jgi:hypothetical protein
MTCPICDRTECANPSFCRACIDADQRKARGEKPRNADIDWRAPDVIPDWETMSPERLYDALIRRARERHGVAKSTINATIYVIQQNDPERLERWLDAHPDQRAALEQLIATME